MNGAHDAGTLADRGTIERGKLADASGDLELPAMSRAFGRWVFLHSLWIYTMFRCALLAATVLFVGLCAAPAAAQMPRPFPATALRGELIVLQPPEVALNGRAARLAPGARIRGDNNLLQLSGALVNQRHSVNYTVDPSGLLLDVWILTAAERARQPWPTSAEQAAAWFFDPSSQTWSRP